MMDAAGAAFTGRAVQPAEKVAQFLLTFDGLAFLPLVTALIVSARLPGTAETGQLPLDGHVIVAGLGTVGTKVIEQLHDLGIDVVGVDKSAEAAGIPVAKRLGIRVVIGETQLDETLLAAGITNCQAAVSVTDSDVANLETALNARALAADTADSRPAVRRRPGGAGAADDRQYGIPVDFVPSRARVRRSCAGSSGAADHRCRQARPADG